MMGYSRVEMSMVRAVEYLKMLALPEPYICGGFFKINVRVQDLFTNYVSITCAVCPPASACRRGAVNQNSLT
jgi:hypothetical protein